MTEDGAHHSPSQPTAARPPIRNLVSCRPASVACSVVLTSRKPLKAERRFPSVEEADGKTDGFEPVDTRWIADSADCRPIGYRESHTNRVDARPSSRLRLRSGSSNHWRPETHGEKSAKPRPPQRSVSPLRAAVVRGPPHSSMAPTPAWLDSHNARRPPRHHLPVRLTALSAGCYAVPLKDSRTG